jgi:hypothetical protein
VPNAALNAVIKGTGTAVPVTGEACAFVSGSDPNKLYRVTNTARRIWDPTAAIVVKDGGTPVGSTLYTFDYLSGKVQFAGYAPAGAITVDGSYLPTIAIAEIRKYSLKITAGLPDVTSFDSAGWHQYIQALKSLEMTLEMFSSPLVDLDGVAGGVQSLFSYLTNDTPKVIELNRGGEFLRAWYRFENINDSAELENALTLELGMRGCALGPLAAFSIST